jgi:hypothetical protein
MGMLFSSEAMKPLVASLGVEKAKRVVKILG